MKKTIKILTLSLATLGILVFIFSPTTLPSNKDFVDQIAESDVIIVFNSGGWGYTPFEKAADFAPIVQEIKTNIEQWGYKTVIIPYDRTQKGFLGKITAMKDFFNYFNINSQILSQKTEDLIKQFPDKKIILTGLSQGGTFVEETIGNISKESKKSVYGITVGTPFWAKPPESDNIIRITNDGKDILSSGSFEVLLATLVKVPLKWIFSKLRGDNIIFSNLFSVKGHMYEWSSEKVGPEIISFLEKKLK